MNKQWIWPILYVVLFIFFGTFADADRLGILIQESDGSPSDYIYKMTVPNSSLSITNGVGTLTFPVAASQFEMETGTEAALRSMSPLRVAQAIAAQTGGTFTAYFTTLGQNSDDAEAAKQGLKGIEKVWTSAPTGTDLVYGRDYTVDGATFDPTSSGLTIRHQVQLYRVVSELMPNQVDRDFSGASAWANVDINAYNETGDLTLTATAAGQYCTLVAASAPTEDGKQYTIQLDVANLIGTWTIKDYDGTKTIGTISANGTNQTFTYTADDANGGFRLVAGTDTASGDFDNFSLNLCDWNLLNDSSGNAYFNFNEFVTINDSDAPGADTEVGQVGANYIDGVDGSENADLIFKSMEGGTETERAKFDQANQRWEFGSYPLNAYAKTYVGSGAITVTTKSAYIICTGACQITFPAAIAGAQYAARNEAGTTGVITLVNRTGQYYELTDHSAFATVNQKLVSGGAATDAISLVGQDSTHYATWTSTGTWTDTAP